MSPAPITQASNPEPDPESEVPGHIEETGTEVEAEPAVEVDRAPRVDETDEFFTDGRHREAEPQTPEPDEAPKRTLVHQTSPEEAALDLQPGDIFALNGENYDVIAHDRAARRITLQVQ